MRARTVVVLQVAARDTRSYFGSPFAYIALALFLAATGAFFVSSISEPFPEASVEPYLKGASLLIVAWAPLVTMRLLAQEDREGTLELVRTMPVHDSDIVLGKFVFSFGVLAATALPTLAYAALLFWYGDPDIGPLISGYLGLFLYGSATMALGLFASSLTSNQLVAAVFSAGALFLLTVASSTADAITGFPSLLLAGASPVTHYEPLARGIVDTRDVVYFVAFAIFFLFATVKSLEWRRWA